MKFRMDGDPLTDGTIEEYREEGDLDPDLVVLLDGLEVGQSVEWERDFCPRVFERVE